MKKQTPIIVLPILVILLGSCKDSGTDSVTPPPAPPPPNALVATPSSVRILPSANAIVAISNGVRPDSITIQPNNAIATAFLSDTSLTVHGVALGSTSLRIRDNSSPQKTIDISISIATTAAAIIIFH